MKTGAKLVAATAVMMSLGGAALAAGGHGHSAQGGPTMQGAGTGNHDMMQMMMRMHAPMMGGDGGMGGGVSIVGMGMPMELFDANGDSAVTFQEANQGLQALLTEYDADGDGSLSLSEFETLHSALLRKAMVDRFQFLDDDGDGAVSVIEIVKPAEMMERMETMRDAVMPGPNDGMMGNGGMMGTPGQGRTGNN